MRWLKPRNYISCREKKGRTAPESYKTQKKKKHKPDLTLNILIVLERAFIFPHFIRDITMCTLRLRHSCLSLPVFKLYSLCVSI